MEKRYLIVLGAMFCALILCQSVSFGQQGDIDAHDPVIIKDGDTYYVFITGRGIPMKRSTDLITWEDIGSVFEQTPQWALDTIGNRSIWAPDVSYFDGEFHIYYSNSSFGSNRSAIGLVTNKTLDPSSPDYEWVDRGMVVESFPGVSDFNCIDANLIIDENGTPWLNWGSFWNGIMMRKLDYETGMLADDDTTIYPLARRPIEVERAIEAPHIIRKNGWYWLFVSHDRCCRGAESTYNVKVGRSKSVTGPYLDADGVDMLKNGGTQVIEGYDHIRGTGHNGILQEGGNDYIVHHYYDANDNGRSKLQIRPLIWGANGFPTAGKTLTGE